MTEPLSLLTKQDDIGHFLRIQVSKWAVLVENQNIMCSPHSSSPLDTLTKLPPTIGNRRVHFSKNKKA